MEIKTYLIAETVHIKIVEIANMCVHKSSRFFLLQFLHFGDDVERNSNRKK